MNIRDVHGEYKFTDHKDQENLIIFDKIGKGCFSIRDGNEIGRFYGISRASMRELTSLYRNTPVNKEYFRSLFKELLKSADARGITIVLFANYDKSNCRTKVTSQKKLKEYYAYHGFEIIDESVNIPLQEYCMIRHPNTESASM